MSASFVGTLVSVFKFLNNKEYQISVKPINGNKNMTIAVLDANRIYNIPAYQREIRWEDKHIDELVHDISSGKTFIGNIILSQHGKDYDVIDGQQRITCLRILIDYIHFKYTIPAALDEIFPCKINIESFSEFGSLQDAHFDTASLTSEKRDLIGKSDKYHQAERYIDLWNALSTLPELKSNRKIREFLSKLKECQLNLVIINNDDDDQKMPIEYFISVNQKGVKLDTEDILKGFLFRFNYKLAEKHWVSIKNNCFAMNYQSGDYQKIMPLIDLFEQYFHCQLYTSLELKDLSFNREFLLKKAFSSSDEDYVFQKGTHLFEVLTDLVRPDATTLESDIENIDVLSKVLKCFVCDSYPAEKYKRLLNPYLQKSSKKLSEDAIQCYANLIQHILLSSEKVPKILVIKYILDILLNKSIKECNEETQFTSIKHKYDSIFSIYTLATLFSLFSGIKGKVRENLYPVVYGENWLDNVYNAIDNFSKRDNTGGRLKTFSYKLFSLLQNDEENTRRDQYRCKSLAGVYNFLIAKNIDSNPVYSFCSPQQMCSFFIDTRTYYTLEHFLLNDKKKYCLFPTPNEKVHTYPPILNKYIGSIYNFIFIHSEVNGAVLGNCVLPAKIEILSGSGTAYDKLSEKQRLMLDQHPITCAYSNAVLSILNEIDAKGNHVTFPLYWEAYEEDCRKGQLDRIIAYYKSAYEEEYISFTEKINNMIIKKLEKVAYDFERISS